MSTLETTRKLLLRARDLSRRAELVAPLLARLTVGVAFAESGWGKVHNLEAVGQFFAELGIPAPQIQATFVSYVELICGSLVLLGLATRLAALPLIGTMIVALLTAKASDIGSFSDLIGTIELCYAVLLAWLALAGPGAASLDHLVARNAAAPTSGVLPGAIIARGSVPNARL
jgi:putative oxidoreductase